MRAMTIDVWMQHPTLRFLRHEMFESLRRWTGQEIPADELPIDAHDRRDGCGGISFGLLSAWHAPDGPLIANDEVAGWVAEHPNRFAGLAAVEPGQTDGCGPRAAALRRGARLHRACA